MQGLWKEKVGGWNHKDSKRKRQTRRQSFKDKAKGIASRHGSNWRFNKHKSQKHRYSKYSFYDDNTRSLEGIYGINFESHRDWITVYPENQGLRKFWQKVANRKTRARTRQWLSKKDYDMNTDVKSHSSEKSIAYDIH